MTSEPLLQLMKIIYMQMNMFKYNLIASNAPNHLKLNQKLYRINVFIK